MFDTVSHFHPSLIISSKAKAYWSGAPYWTFLALLANISVVWKCLSLSDKHVARNNIELTTTVKSFTVQASGGSKASWAQFYKTFYVS